MLKRKILIIDDEEDFCLLLSSFFTDRGADVFVAHTLVSGLQKLAQLKPDILFLDNNLPDGLGWPGIGDIISRYPGLEINLISAYENRDFIYLHDFPVRFWEKPINLEDLDKYKLHIQAGEQMTSESGEEIAV